RSHLVEPRLAELALDIVIGGEAEATVELQACVRRFPRGLRGEVLRHVRLRPAGFSRVEAPARLEAHQVRRLELDVRLGDRDLHALVLPDRAAEDLALARIARHLVDEPVAVADALRGDDRALRVEAVEDV